MTHAIIFLLLVTPWAVNVSKLTDCDFEANYKCEIIHGVGALVAPASFITVWFDTDAVAEDE